MRALVLDGSRSGEAAAEAARGILVAELQQRGYTVDAPVLRDEEIHHCLGCFGCWVQTPGECLIDDPARGIAEAMVRADVAVFLSPVTFGGYSFHLKKALDRIICLVSPFFERAAGEVHHRPRYDRYPRVVGLGVLDREDAEAADIFTDLVARNAINLHAPASAAGVVTAADNPDEVRAAVRTLLARAEGSP